MENKMGSLNTLNASVATRGSAANAFAGKCELSVGCSSGCECLSIGKTQHPARHKSRKKKKKKKKEFNQQRAVRKKRKACTSQQF